MQTATLQTDLKKLFTLTKEAASVYRAFNNHQRHAILQLLRKEGRMNVTDIYEKLGMEQSVASQQLGILREAGAVLSKREGKNILYSINEERINSVYELAKAVVEK